MPRPRSVTDEQILEGTVRAIGRYGPAKLTLAHVAGEVGITAAAIVQRFGSKRALLLAVGESSGRTIDALVDAALERPDPIEALHDVLLDQITPVRSAAEMANHLAFLNLDLADPELRRRARQHGRALLNGIRRLIEAACEAGDLDSDVPEVLAVAVYTTYNGAMISWALVGNGALSTWLRDQIDLTLAPHRTLHRE